MSPLTNNWSTLKTRCWKYTVKYNLNYKIIMSYYAGGTRTFGTVNLCSLSPSIQAILESWAPGSLKKGKLNDLQWWSTCDTCRMQMCNKSFSMPLDESYVPSFIFVPNFTSAIASQVRSFGQISEAILSLRYATKLIFSRNVISNSLPLERDWDWLVLRK